MSNCEKCGKKFGFMNSYKFEWKTKAFHPEWFGKSLHFNCLMQEWKKIPKICTNCGYYEITETIYDEDNWSHSKSQCRKFRIALDIVGDEHHSQRVAMAMKCTSYINEVDYKKKCLSGKLEKGKKVKVEWECRYCKSVNDGKFCNICGAPKKKIESKHLPQKRTPEKLKQENEKESKPSWYIEAHKQHAVQLYED